VYEVAAALTLTAVIVELLLVGRFPWVLAILKRNGVLAALVSLVISWLLGEAFGAAGMTVMLAALASTVLTAAVYRSGALVGAKHLFSLINR